MMLCCNLSVTRVHLILPAVMDFLRLCPSPFPSIADQRKLQ